MDLPQLQALVARSSLLSESDRAYWLATLPTMKPEQCAKLEKILSDAEAIPLQQHITEYFTAVRNSPAAA